MAEQDSRTCSAMDGKVPCKRKVSKRGLCSGHYRRFRENGSTEEDVPIRRNYELGSKCEHPHGCDNPRYCRGLCSMHYNRVAFSSRLGPAGKIYTGKGYINSTGYRRIPVGGGRELAEHRVLMEKHIGRKLYENETVHHLNGIRDDNRMENLEIMVRKSHPPGQRIEDLVLYSVGILERYAPDLLADVS